MIVLSSIAATCLLWIAVALCTQPEPEEKLLAFYKEARPMGWWGPIAQKAGVETGGGALIAKAEISRSYGASGAGRAAGVAENASSPSPTVMAENCTYPHM